MLSSNNNPAGTGDMHEGFEFGWEHWMTLRELLMPVANVWPNDLGFRKSLLCS